MKTFKSFNPQRFSKADCYTSGTIDQDVLHYFGRRGSEICSECGYTFGNHHGDQCPKAESTKHTKRYPTTPRKGDVKEFHGLRFVHNGQFWLQDSFVNTIDRHHNYAGQQDEKKPYRGAKNAHVICGNKLCR